jgi:hypothetical protein
MREREGRAGALASENQDSDTMSNAAEGLPNFTREDDSRTQTVNNVDYAKLGTDLPRPNAQNQIQKQNHKQCTINK